ncbi:Uncharacterised protein [Mycobacteroides abscessus subsp. abscessus]|nr:Uncharacterised protein [Mycobacteroides abscessus subsp. abscessus]
MLRLVEVVQQPGPIGGQSTALGLEQIGAQQVIGGEAEQIPLILDHAGREQRYRRLIAEGFDIESAASRHMEHPLPQLRRTATRVGATNVGIALLLVSQCGAAFGTRGGHDEFALIAVSQIGYRPQHFGNHVTGLANHHRVADQHTLALDLGGIVQGRQRHRGSGHLDRSHVRERGDPPGAAHAHPDVEQLGCRLLRRVLVGDSPAWRARGTAEAALQRNQVDLDDNTVDLVFHVVAMFRPVVDTFLHLGNAPHLGGVRRDG